MIWGYSMREHGGDRRELGPTEILGGVSADEIAWYPSCGTDLRPVMEFGPSRLAFHGLQLAPRILIYTDPSGHSLLRCISPGDVLHSNAARGTVVTCLDQRWISTDTCSDLDGSDCNFHCSHRNEVAMLRIQADSPVAGRCESTVLVLPMSNRQFLLGWVARYGVRFGSLVRVRMGLGMGGCFECLSYVYPWLWWCGCRQMLADGEVHGDRTEQCRSRLISAGFPARPPAFRVVQSGPVVRWSGYDVRALRLEATHGCFDSAHQDRELIASVSMAPWGPHRTRP